MLPFRGTEPDKVPVEIIRYFRIDRRDLVFLKFILEAYEGTATLSTLEPTEAIVSLSIPVGLTDDVQEILNSLTAEIRLTEISVITGETL